MNVSESPIPLGLCQCSCGQRTNISPRSDTRHGHIRGVPFRYVLGHSGRKYQDVHIVDPVTGCHVWQGAKNGKGYGISKGRLAHVLAWEELHGPVPVGKELDHLCRNHPCRNPEHLEPVTRKVNARRGAKAKLTEEAVIFIREQAQAGANQHELARILNVSHGTVWHAIHHKTWS